MSSRHCVLCEQFVIPGQGKWFTDKDGLKVIKHLRPELCEKAKKWTQTKQRNFQSGT